MMAPKVVLFLVDGLRPDALAAAGTPTMERMLREGNCSLTARTVMPSVTLPCTFSMMHGSSPQRHGITTNTYTPQVRPVEGLMDRLRTNGFHTASFFNWEQIRDLSRPGALDVAIYLNNLKAPDGTADMELAEVGLDWMRGNAWDFAFFYLGQLDEVAHREGWMSEAYLRVVSAADAVIGRVIAELGDDVNYLVTADHGGHDQHHGTDMDEDMTIPLLMMGPDLNHAANLDGNVSILDIAPTVAGLFGLSPAEDWAGKNLIRE
ncbi:MAG: alkaline phosphatase family protein [Anaerolineaceae bacterium]|nr:alkaline phosphatase family protein [Anaerolineaceae bacterium]